MREYYAKSIRNVAILGHLGSGKTSLAEALLFVTGAIKAKGEVEKKNTVSDFTIEEQTKQTTLSASLIPVEYNDYKINFLDTPGSEEFIGEVENILSVVKGAVLVLDAAKGIEVGTERCWEELRKRNIPTLILVNKMDKENVKFDNLLIEIREKLGKRAVPFCLPVNDNGFDDYINVIKKKAKNSEIDPNTMKKVENIYSEITEAVAETSEELLDKYFSEGYLEENEIVEGLRVGTLSGDIFPVVLCSAIKNIGIEALLDMIIKYMPSPSDLNAKHGKDLQGNDAQRITTDEAPFSAQVFKTTIDPFVGTINYFKVYSGSVKVGQEILLSNSGQTLKVPQMFSLMGKTQIPMETVHAGDIAAVAKLQDLFTSCTICDKKEAIVFDKEEHPTPTIYIAINPKQKTDEEKISIALQKLSQEDDTFEIKRNPETAQLLIGGQGMTQINNVLDKMRNTFKVEVTTSEPKVVYRETIKGHTDQHGVQGRHKKQSGGAGQFGDVWIRFEPCEEDFIFQEEVFGGAVPKNYFPAVEKGLVKALEHGPLAGFPVIGVKATLTDGSYHPVDSNEISFVIAAGLSFKAACEKIRPTILEPIMEVKILVKSEYLGAVMGDMNKRRGRILGTEELSGGKTELTAEVPESEILKYTTELKAMTQASGRFARKFLRYDEVPEMLIKKIVEEYKKQ